MAKRLTKVESSSLSTFQEMQRSHYPVVRSTLEITLRVYGDYYAEVKNEAGFDAQDFYESETVLREVLNRLKCGAEGVSLLSPCWIVLAGMQYLWFDWEYIPKKTQLGAEAIRLSLRCNS